jgi:GT2 family glycosyltransferase
LNDPTPISVVIASHGRPGHLRRCLTALRFQAYPRFEVVVVADGAGLSALRDDPAAEYLKTLRFDEENLSRARNLGVAQASGDIVAFIDDDSVAEPTWLSFLSQPLRSDGAAAAVGAVRGRNGISFQSRTPWIDRTAQSFESDTAEAPSPIPGGAVPKLVGTNMAVRREALVSLGGFDERLRFFLEDSDLSLRLADAGHVVAFAPTAQVLHAFAESTRRTKDRRPLTLFEIGRSLAIFLRKHAGTGEVAAATARFLEAERRRVIAHMIRGTCGPEDVAPLLATFEAGVEEGKAAPDLQRADWGIPPEFLPFPALRPDAEVHLLATDAPRDGRLKAEAARLADAGHVVTLMEFGRTTLYHRVGFDPRGYWTQSGGLYGRSDRSGPLLRFVTLEGRVREEWARTGLHRTPSGATIRSQIRWINRQPSAGTGRGP